MKQAYSGENSVYFPHEAAKRPRCGEIKQNILPYPPCHRLSGKEQRTKTLLSLTSTIDKYEIHLYYYSFIRMGICVAASRLSKQLYAEFSYSG